jgi:putative colanic acid biosynthesis acetyltransferase WcaF
VILQGADGRTGPSFSLGNRMARAVWGVAWMLLFMPTPRTAHRWRVAVLRLFGAKVGRHVRIHGSCRIWAPWQLEIGDRVGIGEGAILYNMGRLRIGHEATVSQEAYLCGGSHDPSTRNFQLIAGEITIGEQAWVCTQAFIGPGVTVPEGCVVGARAVLTRTPQDGAWGVYVGNPARRVKTRRFRD